MSLMHLNAILYLGFKCLVKKNVIIWGKQLYTSSFFCSMDNGALFISTIMLFILPL